VGRTGRAGARGEAITLLNEKNLRIATGLIELVKEAGQPVPAWLLGMPHMSRAQIMKEEEQILAGSGEVPETNVEVQSVVDDTFSGQDFRRHAVEGC
jgi:superfamily II DNA/RNA helicase